MKWMNIVLVLGLMFANFASANIINVPGDSTTIQAGINGSNNGDTVLVQPGTYVENINFNGHNIVLGSLFLTAGDTSYIPQTIIDGNGSGIVVTFSCGEDSTTIITGFTIKNGYNNEHNSHGAGIKCENNSNPVISNNTISGDTCSDGSGGGIWCQDSSPRIKYNKINNNRAYRHGGGIGCINSNSIISNNIISGNRSLGRDGGGILCGDGSSLQIIENTIIGNYSGYSGSRFGGGIYAQNAIIRGNVISGNHGWWYGGGGVYSEGESIIEENTISGSSSGVCSMTNFDIIRNNTIIDNGIGIVKDGMYTAIDNNIISGNGTGIRCLVATGMITHNIIYGNGTGIVCQISSNPLIINNTISNNSRGVDCWQSSNPTIINTILWENGAPQEGIEIYNDNTSNPMVIFCNIEGGWEGEGNIDIDPLFRDPENDDFHLMATDCGNPYNSPCIDAGHPDILDSLLSCEWGLGDSISDMGAYGGYIGIPDLDDDGIPDYVDNCITAFNPDQLNSDGDSYGDSCDNCQYADNEDQADYDGDGIGDVCDPDYFIVLAGTVTDEMFYPIEGVYVLIEGTAKDDSTDINGEYLIDSLDTGTYDISFTHFIYKDTIVYDIQFLIGDTTYLDVTMNAIPPVLSLSNAQFFEGLNSFNPLSGDENTLFEFRINYRDSANSPPQTGYPQMLLDWDGNGTDDNHPNDGQYPMALSQVDSVYSDGADYSVFASIPEGGNPRIRFEAYNEYGGYAIYPESEWLVGPEIFDPDSTDLYIYANDIMFSTDPDMPDVGEDIIISARIHNNSSNPRDSVKVNLYIDTVFIESFYLDIPSTDIYGEPGQADLSYGTILNEADYLEIKFTVDPDDSIAEFSESNNTAVRGLIVGDYDISASIQINASQLNSYYPISHVTGGGSAWYEEDGNSLEPVAGAPAYLRIIEGDIDVGTIYVNDDGYFYYHFICPSDTGLYSLEITVTDFTLSNTVIVPFEVIPASGPDLIIEFDLNGLHLNVCENNTLYIDNPRVRNVGHYIAGPSKAIIIAGTETLIDEPVPELEPEDIYYFSGSQLTVTHETAGDYSVIGIADYDDEVEEDVEGNNQVIENYEVWCCPIDLSPVDIRLNRIPYINIPVAISAKVYNIGGQDADNFSLLCTVNNGDSTITIGTLYNLSIPAYQDSGWFTFDDYTFLEAGLYEITIIADPDFLLYECDEDNNTYSEWRYVNSLKPDLTVQSEWISLSDLNPGLDDTFYVENIDIHNYGDITANNVDVLCILSNILGEDTLGIILSIPSISPSGYESVIPTDSVLVESCIPNLHVVRVETDPFNNIEEKNEGNNNATRAVIYCAAPDLYIDSLFFEPECEMITDSVSLFAVIGNNGDTTASANVDFYYLLNPESDWDDKEFIAQVSLADIPPGTETTLATVPWEVVLDSTYIYVEITDILPDDFNPANNHDSEFFFCRPPGVITGTVTDYEGRAVIPDVLVEVLEGEVVVDSDYTDIDGNYIITEIPSKQFYNIAFSKNGYYDSTVAGIYINVGDTIVVDMVLHRAGNYSGTVSDYYDAPLPDVHVYAVAADPVLAKRLDAEIPVKNNIQIESKGQTFPPLLLDVDLVTEMWTSPTGEFSLLLDPGTYSVVCDTNSWDPDTSGQFIISLDTIIADQDVILRRPGSLSGTVKNSRNLELIENVHVVIDTGIVLDDDFTNSLGQYSIANLYNCDYKVTYTHEDYDTLIIYNLHIDDGQYMVKDTVLVPSGYEYLPGDVNMSAGTWPPAATGPDVTYLVNFFRGVSTSHSCLLGGFWCSADANGDCNIIGSDVTKLVNVFRGIGSITWCGEDPEDPPSYEPAWPTPADLPVEAPVGWPNCEE